MMLWSAQAHVPPQLPGTAGVGAHEHRRGRPCGRRGGGPQTAVGVGAAGVGAVGDSRWAWRGARSPTSATATAVAHGRRRRARV